MNKLGFWDWLSLVWMVAMFVIMGNAYGAWYEQRDKFFDAVMACEEEVRGEYREANVPLTMDEKELWMSCAEEVQSTK